MSAVIALASLALASRWYPHGIGERGLAAVALALGHVHVVTSALGWTQTLTRTSVVLLSIVLSLGQLALAFGPSRDRAVIARRMTEPFTALVSLLRDERSLTSGATLGFVWVFGLALYTFGVAYLAPSGAWDGLWYHEPMVGFAIQNHGYQWVDLPDWLQWINGYPRGCENFMLFIAILGDRRLIDGVPSVMLLTSLLAFYVMAQRFAGWKSGALLFGCVLVTIPGVALQLRSTYVDVTVLATFLPAFHFATRDRVRAADLWMIGLTLGLMGTTKLNVVMYAGMVGLVALARAWPFLQRDRRLWLHFAGAVVLFLALAVPTYARNIAMHANPFWPLRVDSPFLAQHGIHIDGPNNIMPPSLSFEDALHHLFDAPEPGSDYHDTRSHAYGYGLSFIGIPLLMASLWFLARFGRRALRQGSVAARRFGGFASVFVIGALTMILSPSFAWARFQLPAPAAGLLAMHAAQGLRARPGRALGASLGFAMLFANALTLFWAAPAWDVTVHEAYDLFLSPPAERVLADTSNCLLVHDTRAARERSIGTGDVVAITDRITFVGNVWNERFDNRVVFVRPRPRAEFLAELDRIGAEWLYAPRMSAEASAAASAPERWHLLGTASFEEVIYERVGAP